MIVDFKAGLYAQAFLFAVYLGLAVWGLYQWSNRGQIMVKRTKEPEFFAEIRDHGCCVNGCNQRAQVAHIKSRGAGGSNDPDNVVPLCWLHHTEQHTLGWPRFRKRYPEVKSWKQLTDEALPMMRICRDCEFNGIEASDYPVCENAFRRDITVCPGYRAEF